MNEDFIKVLAQIKKNPQQTVMQLLQNQMGNTPMGQNLIQLAQKGDIQSIENIARKILAQQGLDFDKEFAAFKKQWGL